MVGIVVLPTQEQADAALRQLQKGASFPVFAKLHSRDASAENGGALGPLGGVALSPTLQQAVAGLHVGAYSAALLTSQDSALTHIPYLWTLPVAMAVTMLAGLLLGGPTLRLRGDYLAIVTLGFGEIIRLLATIVGPLKGQVGFQAVGRPPGTDSTGQPLFSNSDGTTWYWLVVTITIVILLAVGNLERSRVGRAWIAIREDEDAAQIMGVPTVQFKLWAFVIGAAIGGLSGALFAGQVGFVNNQKFDVTTSILYLAAVVLGGQGNKVGVVVGAFLVSYLPDRFQATPEVRYLIFGLALIVLMVFRPQGLLGMRQHLLAYGRSAHRRLFGAGTAVPVTGEGATE